LQCHGFSAIFQQEVQFTEHLRDVPTVDLVDEQHVYVLRIALRIRSDPQQGAGLKLESCGVAFQHGTKTVHEIFVRVRRVELYDLDAITVTGEELRKFLAMYVFPVPGGP
jgi:hypothetical protein